MLSSTMTSPSISIPETVPRYIPYRAESDRETESVLDGFVFPSPPSTPSSPVIAITFNERWQLSSPPLSPTQEQLSQPPSPGPASPCEAEKPAFPKQSLPRFYSTPLDPKDPDSTPIHVYGLEQRFESYVPRRRPWALPNSRPRSIIVTGGVDEMKPGATARSGPGAGAGAGQGPKRFVSKKSPLSASFSIPDGGSSKANSNADTEAETSTRQTTTTRPASSHLATLSSSSSTSSLSSSTTTKETTTRATTPATTPILKPSPTPDNTLKQSSLYFSSSTLSLPLPPDHNTPTTTLPTYSSSTADLTAAMLGTTSSASASVSASASGPRKRTLSKPTRRQSILFWKDTDGSDDDNDNDDNNNNNNAEDNVLPPSSGNSDKRNSNNTTIHDDKNKSEKKKKKGGSRHLIHRSLTRTFNSLRLIR